MSDDGNLKDDVKVPEGDVGDKINKLFHDDGKDTSKDLQELCTVLFH
jgi:translation initiation factor 5A